MNFEQLCELERNYINFTKDVYIKPVCQKRVKSMTFYKSMEQNVGTIGFYYIFLLDYFVCAFKVDGVEFFNEQELREKFSEV